MVTLKSFLGEVFMKYAIITNNVVTNVAVCDSPEFAAEQGWVQCTEEVSSDWTYDNGNFAPPPDNRPSWEEQEAAILRKERDQKLSETDWVVTKYLDVAGGVPEAWKQYRQALRDLPQMPDFPRNFKWPVKPE